MCGLVAATPVLAQNPTPIPNTVACEAFKKNADGTWSVISNTSFTIAGMSAKLAAGARVTATSYFYDNNRLIDVLNAKCGGS